MNDIKYHRNATKSLKKINTHDAVNIFNKIQLLKQDKDKWKNVMPLKNHTYGYRLRVGSYRVLFDFLEVVKIVKIEKITNRDDNTY